MLLDGSVTLDRLDPRVHAAIKICLAALARLPDVVARAEAVACLMANDWRERLCPESVERVH
jgi:hypothetical protein